MGALENYLDDLNRNHDVSHLLDADITQFESEIYSEPTIYKYFSPVRRAFFAKPQLRLSQREVLNDPLELSARWNDAKTNALRAHMAARLSEMTPKFYVTRPYRYK